MQKPPEEDEDARLFRAAVSDVRRLTTTHRQPDKQKPLSTRPRKPEVGISTAITDSRMTPDPDVLEAGDILQYRSEGVQDSVMRKLKRGQYRIEMELDLHGCTREQALPLVADFLTRGHAQGRRCVRIIHGKGHGSHSGEAILKSHTASWLRRNNAVIAYCSARPIDGGTGAVYVLLRANNPTR